MDQCAKCGTILSKVCNLTDHEKSEKYREWASVQGEARHNLDFENKLNNIFVIQVFFVTKEQQYVNAGADPASEFGGRGDFSNIWE